jgi:hypothetical protein
MCVVTISKKNPAQKWWSYGRMGAHILRKWPGHMVVYIMKPGAGAKPQPGPPKLNTISNLNIFETIYIRRTYGGTPVGRPLPKLWMWGGPGFDPHRLHKILNNQPNKWVPRGSPRLGHVAPNHLTKNMPRVKI